MVVIAELVGTVDIDSIFPLLEITRVPMPTPKKKLKRPKMPPCDIPGAILSARYKGIARGVIRNSAFRNAIIIDICNGTKNVNIKLSRKSLHICGTKSLAMATQAAELLLDQVRRVQERLDWLNQDLDRKEALFQWLLDNTKGPAVLDDGFIRRKIVLPTIPSELDSDVASYLLKMASEFLYYDDFKTQLQWLRGIDRVIEQDISVGPMRKAMVNYNYDLGFNIDRFKFCQLINGFNGFMARYDNDVEHNVTVNLPYESDKPGKSHTFTVYRSGFVTQSGPDEERMKEAYNLFIDTVLQIRSQVMKKGVHKLHYKFVHSEDSSELDESRTAQQVV